MWNLVNVDCGVSRRMAQRMKESTNEWTMCGYPQQLCILLPLHLKSVGRASEPVQPQPNTTVGRASEPVQPQPNSTVGRASEPVIAIDLAAASTAFGTGVGIR
jgi:hypothetical protein